MHLVRQVPDVPILAERSRMLIAKISDFVTNWWESDCAQRRFQMPLATVGRHAQENFSGAETVKVVKQVLRKQIGMVLIETTVITGLSDSPARVSYSISSKGDPKIRCFDDLQIAQSYFEDEASYCRKPLHSFQDRHYA